MSRVKCSVQTSTTYQSAKQEEHSVEQVRLQVEELGDRHRLRDADRSETEVLVVQEGYSEDVGSSCSDEDSVHDDEEDDDEVSSTEYPDGWFHFKFLRTFPGVLW
jgi:hypothetical protein